MDDNDSRDAEISAARLQLLRRELKRLERKFVYWRAFDLVMWTVFVIGIAYAMISFPAGSIPALGAAMFARWRFRAPSAQDPRFLFSTAFSRVAPWAITGGAVGYTLLAAFGIGVPAADAALQWRIFGGLVFGAAAGVAAALVVCRVALFWGVTEYTLDFNPIPKATGAIRPVTRFASATLGLFFLVVLGGVTGRLWIEGFFSRPTWQDWGIFLTIAVLTLVAARIFLQVAWTGRNPPIFEAIESGGEPPSA
jgi:hypothetical protein